MKKLLSVILALVLVLALLPATALAVNRVTGTVDSVALTVTLPKVGERADLSATLPEDANYTLLGGKIGWFCDEDDALIAEGAIFEAKTYIFSAVLEPIPGCTIAPDVTGTLNGESVNTWVGEGQVYMQKYFTLGADDSVIDSVALTVTLPKVGERADLSATLPADAGYTLEGGKVMWYCDEDDAPIAEGAVFEAKTYIFSATLVPKAGYSFTTTGITGTLNGESANTWNGDGGKVLMSKYFTLEEDSSKVINSVALTVTLPKLGEKANLSGAVPADAGYTLEGGKVMWYCDEDDAPIAEGAVFEAKTYIFDAILVPKEGYSFAPDPELTGTLNGGPVGVWTGDGKVFMKRYFTLGLENPFTDAFESDYFYDAVVWAYYADPQVTNGKGNNLFAPDDMVKRGEAVTFLWRAVGCPEPKDPASAEKFTDLTEAYYMKAVAWAVEQGITKGTNEAQTEFSPEQTCSTAHILTFLYRTLGIGDDGWYDIAEAWAKGAGLLEGLNVSVAPGVDCPRRDVVLFLYRAVGK